MDDLNKETFNFRSFTVKDCGPVVAPSNGTVTVNVTSVGGVATYRCSPGFTLDGPSFRICSPDGVWEGTMPQCRGKKSFYLLPTGSEEKGVLEFGIIPGAILPSNQDMKTSENKKYPPRQYSGHNTPFGH